MVALPKQLSQSEGLSAPQKALKKMGLIRDIDLALHLPMRYEDETFITPLANALEGEIVHFYAEIVRQEVIYKPKRQLIVQVRELVYPNISNNKEEPVVEPTQGEMCTLRFFNFYASLQKTMAVGQRVRLRGECRGGLLGKTLMHPSIYAWNTELPKTLTPKYSTVAGLPQTYLRRAVMGALERSIRREEMKETIPKALLKPGSWSLVQSVKFLHQPDPHVSVLELADKSHPAWCRLKAEELLAQQLSQLKAKHERSAMKALKLEGLNQGLTTAFFASLPFKLTRAQLRVVDEIAEDLRGETPMYRLLQGDVGSGKTVVAALAATQCIDSGYQCALMAPTEILVDQHFQKMMDWLAPLVEAQNRFVVRLMGSQKKKERDAMLEMIRDGRAALVVGTHAVIQDSVHFDSLGLVVIDEQHRFGVAQRIALRDKTNKATHTSAKQEEFKHALEPHLLMMSATPIPRTLAMSYYADLDISTLDELPAGRTPVVTKLLSEERRGDVVHRIQAQIKEGRQVYWVCPLIEESEALDLTNAVQTHNDLRLALPGINVGLLHSKMPAQEKKEVMQAFKQGHTGVLVSTTVIEVGVDVPNASLMVIEHAERFGLSQLHQLRGRVGRGSAASACVLLYSTPEHGRLSQSARDRLKAMVQTQDGFEIAKRDLEIRGPGEFLGARQSGAAMLRFADLSTDQVWLDWARVSAPKMLEAYPELVQEHLARWLGSKEQFLKA
jgi:ATP-dependent DNA helicase RecG